MLQLPGYRIQEIIYEGSTSIVYRALSESDQLPVMIKTFVDRYPPAGEVARMEREFELAQDADSDLLVHYHKLIPTGNTCALVIEDFGAESLRELLNDSSLPLHQFLTLARHTVRSLSALHSSDIVHRDISPGNILVNRRTGEVKIADLGLASRIPRSTQSVVNPERLEGTLAYISPEQTGRMNRAVDYRTDYYSMGCVFYQMLTGRIPFHVADPMAMLHAHIAMAPLSPSALDDRIPEIVSRIVLKLMAKTAEDRYQSAHGIEADLTECIRQLDSLASIENFELGRSDHTGIFRISQKLYGRQAESKVLLKAFEKVSDGACELMLVRGYSGIGKSMLVHEVHKPMVARNGYFIAGKFDQLEMTKPLSGVLQAVNDLIRQLLSESDAGLDLWKKKISTAIGANGRVLLDMLPQLELIIGKQPEVLGLGPSEARDRFNSTLFSFIQAVAAEEHPVAMFLDDLQWVDPASLRLLSELVSHPASGHLLVIGAYRDNEVSPSHPLMLSMNKLGEQGISMASVDLKALSPQDLTRLCADSLHRSLEHVRPLAELLEVKTGGNPFFVIQFLEGLAANGLIHFETDNDQWEWDLDKIALEQVVDNVVELMVDKIRAYGSLSESLLTLAGCLGNTFDLGTLATISGHNPRQAARGIWDAVREGLLLPLDNGYEHYQWSDNDHEDAPSPEQVCYRFAHDRIQEAAYSQVPATELATVNLRIGRLLLQKIPTDQRDAHIFDFINHLNLGVELLEDPSERNELARLNLIAGKRAKNSTAYKGAQDYLKLAVSLLPDDPWKNDYELCFELHRERIDTEFLCGNIEIAEELFREAAPKAKSRKDIGDIYQLMIRIHLTADRPADGLEVGLECLRLFDLELAKDPDEANSVMDKERSRIAELIGDREVRSLIDSPVLTDPEMEMAMGLLHEIWTCAVMAPDFGQMTHTALKIVRLSLEHGHSKFSACGYVAHALVLTVTAQYEDARAYGHLSMDLCHRFEDVFIIPKVHNTFANFTNHFINHIKTNVDIYEESYRNCLLSGDTWWGAWAAGWIRTAKLVKGDPIGEVLQTQGLYHKYIEDSGYVPLWYMSRLDRQILLCLKGKTESPTSFSTDDTSEEELVKAFADMPFGFGLYLFNLYKAFVSYLMGDNDAVPPLLAKATEYRDHIPFLMPYPDYFFYSTLLLAPHVAEATEEDANFAAMLANTEQMKIWVGVCAENFEHRHLLMSAEIERLRGHDERATHLYEAAIESATANEFLQNEALANELAARHLLAQGRHRAAMGYLTEAHFLFGRWGATTKARQLEDEFPKVLMGRRASGAFPSLRESPDMTDWGTISSSRTMGLEHVDLTTVIKASQAVSGELHLDRLLERLMRISIENAGAQRGVIIIVRERGPYVEAISSVDQEGVQVKLAEPLDTSNKVPRSVVQYVMRTGSSVVVDDALAHEVYSSDPYIIEHGVRSMMCLPAIKQGRCLAVLYMQNDLVSAAFQPKHVSLLTLLAGQAAVALENAVLYDTLEQKVELRTRQLADTNTELAEKNQEILRAQAQLVQSEKMASLGQLVAGIAHEINNPINFISSGLPSLRRDVNKLSDMVDDTNRDRKYDKVTNRIERLLGAIDEGARRTAEIVTDLRSFSRLDEAEFKSANLHEALDATLTLLRNKLRDSVEVVKEYNDIPQIDCFISQLNQVFMNLMSNAIQAMEGSGTLTIRTAREDESHVTVAIKDTGSGMSEEVKNKIFDPFFTTKDVGEGTGLGLSISHGIIEKHSGRFEVDSAPGKGTEFRVILPIRPIVEER